MSIPSVNLWGRDFYEEKLRACDLTVETFETLPGVLEQWFPAFVSRHLDYCVVVAVKAVPAGQTHSPKPKPKLAIGMPACGTCCFLVTHEWICEAPLVNAQPAVPSPTRCLIPNPLVHSQLAGLALRNAYPAVVLVCSPIAMFFLDCTKWARASPASRLPISSRPHMT